MTYQPNHRGLGELLVSPDMESAMRQLAGRVMARAVATAPDAAPYGTGYVDSFELDSGVRPGATPRAFGRVRNTSDHALFVEFGARNTPRHRTLGKALDAVNE